MSEIKLIINGKECVGKKGQTILQVAEANGIDIPPCATMKTSSTTVLAASVLWKLPTAPS